jgi:hypothetical protein
MVAVSAPLTNQSAVPRATVVWARDCARAIYTGVMTARPPGRYESLRVFLASQPGEELTLTFAEIERLLGAPLPAAAWLRAWWTNAADEPQARAWLKAGWRVRWVRRQGSQAAVTFSRSTATLGTMP